MRNLRLLQKPSTPLSMIPPKNMTGCYSNCQEHPVMHFYLSVGFLNLIPVARAWHLSDLEITATTNRFRISCRKRSSNIYQIMFASRKRLRTSNIIIWYIQICYVPWAAIRQALIRASAQEIQEGPWSNLESLPWMTFLLESSHGKILISSSLGTHVGISKSQLICPKHMLTGKLIRVELFRKCFKEFITILSGFWRLCAFYHPVHQRNTLVQQRRPFHRQDLLLPWVWLLARLQRQRLPSFQVRYQAILPVYYPVRFQRVCPVYFQVTPQVYFQAMRLANFQAMRLVLYQATRPA